MLRSAGDSAWRAAHSVLHTALHRHQPGSARISPDILDNAITPFLDGVRMSDQDTLLRVLDQAQRQGGRIWKGLSSRELSVQTGIPWTTTKRLLLEMQNAGTVIREGQARSTRYKPLIPPPGQGDADQTGAFPRFDAGKVLLVALKRPLGQRAPVAYQRVFVDGYEPNQSQLLPSSLLTDLEAAARMSGQQPAGTYVGEHNCSRFYVTMRQVQQWIAAGRPY